MKQAIIKTHDSRNRPPVGRAHGEQAKRDLARILAEAPAIIDEIKRKRLEQRT